MNHHTSGVPLVCLNRDRREIRDGLVVNEHPLTIFVNGHEFLTTLCTPVDVDYLVAGILESEDVIHDWNDIADFNWDFEKGTASVTTYHPVKIDKKRLKPLVASGGGKGSSLVQKNPAVKIGSGFTILAEDVRRLMSLFLQSSDTYRRTHGVHGAALCRDGNIVYFNDDIGRHNALDKIAGWRLSQHLDASELAVMTSGRISSEILLKTARRGFPVIISKAPPTDLGVKLAIEWGVTMVRCQVDSVCIYSHDWRVI